MRSHWIILALGLLTSGCATYRKEAVRFSEVADIPRSGLVVDGPAQPIGVTGLGPMIWEVEPTPDLPSYSQAKLRTILSASDGVKCTVSNASAQVSNSLTSGSIATSMQFSCTSGGGSFVASGRDVRQLKVGWKGVDMSRDLQPGIDGCLQQIAVQIDRYTHR